MARIAPLDPATYQRHRVHTGDRVWAETNCYSDVVIELLHGLGYEPLAAMPFTLTIDFDVDQWTFFKFPNGDVEDLYALGIHELAPWKPLAEHVEAHVGAGRPVMVELDSFYLPDTAGTAYGLAHVKSTVAVNEIDVAARRMGYFHNQGYYALEGKDFLDIFQVEGLVHPRMLPPYIEFLKPIRNATALRGPALVDASLRLLRKHLARIPAQNPFRTFQARFAEDLRWLANGDIEAFHAYSFVTLRQYGACYELASTYLRWLGEQGADAPGADKLDQIAQGTKAYQFQLARAIVRRRSLDLGPLDGMAALWDAAMDDLVRRCG